MIELETVEQNLDLEHLWLGRGVKNWLQFREEEMILATLVLFMVL